MARFFLLFAVIAVVTLSGCGFSAKPGPPDPEKPLIPVSLDGFQPHDFTIQTKGLKSESMAGNNLDETLEYSLRREQESLVAELKSLRYSQLELRKGADVSMLMKFARQPEDIMQAAVDRTFDTPYSRFQIDKRGQDFNHEIVAHRESILIIGKNAAGVISLFLAPRRLDDLSWSRAIVMPTNDGVMFRGDLHYKVMGNDQKESPLVNVIVSGRLTADGTASLVVRDDMPAAFDEGRPAKRWSAEVDQSHWSFKGVLRYSRDFQQWASGSVRTEISMRIQTPEGVTIRQSAYLMTLVQSAPRKKPTAP